MSQGIPSVETRIYHVERALALGTMLSRALGQAGDIGLRQKDEAAAFSLLADVFDDALTGIRAVNHLIPTDIHNADAPEVE